MTKREQLFLFWTLALVSVAGLVFWISTLPQTEVMIAGVRVGEGVIMVMLAALALFVLLLIAATILMPLFVVGIHGLLKKLLAEQEKQTALLRKMAQQGPDRERLR